MWQDHIPVLFERFELLKQQRARNADPQIELVLRKYEEFCFEMLEGVRTLLLNLIESQAYIRKKYPHMELRMYLDIHTGIMDHLAACGSESLDSIPAFHYELLQLIEQVRGYCIILKQDILSAFSRSARLQRDRQFRQINLLAKQTIEAIGRLQEKTAALSRLIGGRQSEYTLKTVESGEAAYLELISTAGFSDEEQRLLLKDGVF